jgi:hypothetical protein
MMNIVKLQDHLKNFSQEQLISAMQMPDGSTPQYLVLGEIMRRKQMESSAAGQPAPESTVAEDAVAAAGVPQGGIADMARALAPKTDMAQNTGVQAMARGGPVKKMAEGDVVVSGGMQYEDDTIFDPITGVPITGGGVVGEPPPGPSTGSYIQDLIQSEETRAAVQAIRDRQAAAAAAAAAPATPDVPAEPEPPTTPDVPAVPQGGGGGGMSPFEQQLMDALASREKAAKQDKWLALAQVGLNLMSSTQPTLLGAVGEAGLKGVESARAARDQYDKDKLDLQGALEQSRMARAAASARAASGASAGGLTPLQAYKLERDARKDAFSELSTIQSIISSIAPMGTPLNPGDADRFESLKAYEQNLTNQLFGDAAADTSTGEEYDVRNP